MAWIGAYALLAAGQIDLVIEAGLNAYDIQGPDRRDLSRRRYCYRLDRGRRIWGRVVAAATPELHADAIHITRGDPRMTNMDHQKCPHNPDHG